MVSVCISSLFHEGEEESEVMREGEGRGRKGGMKELGRRE